MDKQLNEVESLCLSGIKKGSPEAVEMYFGPYLAYKPSTQHSAFIKAYMLLHYFSTGPRKMFYTTLETVTAEELGDESIKLVLEVDMCVNVGAVERLKKLVASNSRKELAKPLRDILEGQLRSVEASDCPAEPKAEVRKQGDKRVIEDAIFIGRNSSGNF